MKNSPMSPSEAKATFGLATIYSMRMLGLFMILPVFSAYADKLQSASPLLIGLGISIYGLTQAIFQIPYGLASDRFGRKRVIGFGLILFILGSVMAAQATSIYMVIAGRALQGSGAIAAATMALLADLTRENQRTKAMAGIGMSIGLAFAVSLVLGPMIASQIGLSGIFWLTAIFAVLALLILFLIIPNPVRQSVHRDAQTLPSLIKYVTTDPQLLRLDIGIFILHLVMTAGFVVLPVLIIKAGMPVVDHWKIYLPTLLVSFAVMIPAIIIAETRNKMKTVFLTAILLVSLSELGFAFFHQSIVTISAAMFVFFAGFNILEATLPSLISKLAPVESKGTAMGIYSTSQFLGAFCGGTLAGWISGQWNVELLFLLLALFVLIWLLIASFMKTPKRISSLLWSVTIKSQHQAQQMTEDISNLDGIEEAVIIPEEGVAYLKVNKSRLNFEDVEQILGKQVAS